MKEVHSVNKITCDGLSVRINTKGNQRLSMLIVGNARSGKTYFSVRMAVGLIQEGYAVYLIDLGQKWSMEDKEKLCNAGADVLHVATDNITLYFPSLNELFALATYMADALGFRSLYAKSVIESAMKELLKKNPRGFMFKTLVHYLQDQKSVDEWSEKIANKFSNLIMIPEILFTVDESVSDAVNKSIIWDLDDLDHIQVQLLTNIILYDLYCNQRKSSKYKTNKKIFVIIDEFQNLNCSQHSIIGTCLTEAQKTSLYLILVTQFIQDKFAASVVKQFKQGGYRFYFRLTEEEAWEISRQLAYKQQDKLAYYNELIKLRVGQCLMLGEHFIGNRQEISESPRFVNIEQDDDLYVLKTVNGVI